MRLLSTRHKSLRDGMFLKNGKKNLGEMKRKKERKKQSVVNPHFYLVEREK
jgi:hypothetical protein